MMIAPLAVLFRNRPVSSGNRPLQSNRSPHTITAVVGTRVPRLLCEEAIVRTLVFSALADERETITVPAWYAKSNLFGAGLADLFRLEAKATSSPGQTTSTSCCRSMGCSP
jgi:hypothetical protein